MNSRIEDKIRSFRTLPEGWHFGEGVGATDVTVNTAIFVTDLLSRFWVHDMDAFPCVDGGVLVHGYRGDDTIEIQCDPDGRIHIAHERGRDSLHEREDVSMDEIKEYLGELKWGQISSFEFSIQDITVLNVDDTQVRLSNPRQATREFPYSIWSVALLSADRCATISALSTGNARLLLYSGEDAPLISPTSATLNAPHRPVEMTAIATSMG